MDFISVLFETAELQWYYCHGDITTALVANVFIHREPVDSATMLCDIEDEMSDGEDAEVRQKIVYKIGKLFRHTILVCL